MILELLTASIYYEIRGSGPYLFIVQSGEGDANRTAQLVDALQHNFAIVTYDRRGLSRSVGKEQDTCTLSTHSDDLAGLISSISSSPVHVLGCSIGAAIALRTAHVQPGLIDTLITHEPVMPSLLPIGSRDAHITELKDIQDIYTREGWLAGIKYMAKVLGINPKTQAKESDAFIEPMTLDRKDNFDFFIQNDLESIIRSAFSIADLIEVAQHTNILPAVGKETSPDLFDYKCADIISKTLNKELVVFPGGHNGNCTHPKGYAGVLGRMLK